MPNSTKSASRKPAGYTHWVRPLLLFVGLSVLLLGGSRLGLGQHLYELRAWVETLGGWGPVVFVFLYAAAVVLAVPGTALTLAAGALFGSAVGVAVVSAGATLGAASAFLIARHLARRSVAAWLSESERFRRLDDLTHRHGATIVALTRLVPLFPFNLLNYGFGLTGISFKIYVFWSWLCMLPATLVYVAGADALARGLTDGNPAGPLTALGGGLLILLLLARYARVRLRPATTEFQNRDDRDRTA